MRLGIVGLESDRSTVARSRLLQPAAPFEQNAKIVVSLSRIRIEYESLSDQSFGGPAVAALSGESR